MSARRRQRGFTLVEVIVASGVVAVSVMGLCAAVVTSLRAAAVERERTVALAAAEARMDALLALLARDPSAVDTSSTVPFAVDGLAPTGADALPGRARVSSWADQLVSVEVDVAWRGAMGDDRIHLSTLAAKR